ncbi:unnamed protein product [Caenorhabditis sp. 36 PRJEB53466]|nr:unnamed protein product [Caenorhabditis sp. 36 PRJEB53466]
MPYRPEAELKRPDLKGEFLCGHCGKTFCHAASLNRHRLNFHGDDQQCMVCMQQISQNDTVRRHMQTEHGIPRVFTCGCCNWTFPDKKELHSHNNSMMKTGGPGEAKAIAISSRPPGSLSQHELRGEERSPRIKKRSPKAAVPTAEPDKMLSMLSSLLNQQSSVEGASAAPPASAPSNIPASWIQALLNANPAFLQFLQMPSSSASSTTSSSETETAETPEPVQSPLESVLSMISNNNEGETSTEDVTSGAEEENVDVVDEDEKDQLVKAVGTGFLSVSTEQPVCNSASESGSCSVPASNTPSPVSSSSMTSSGVSASSPTDSLVEIVKKTKKANKRRSIDDICVSLVAKK